MMIITCNPQTPRKEDQSGFCVPAALVPVTLVPVTLVPVTLIPVALVPVNLVPFGSHVRATRMTGLLVGKSGLKNNKQNSQLKEDNKKESNPEQIASTHKSKSAKEWNNKLFNNAITMEVPKERDTISDNIESVPMNSNPDSITRSLTEKLQVMQEEMMNNLEDIVNKGMQSPTEKAVFIEAVRVWSEHTAYITHIIFYFEIQLKILQNCKHT
jgi:hypothetical protein